MRRDGLWLLYELYIHSMMFACSDLNPEVGCRMEHFGYCPEVIDAAC